MLTTEVSIIFIIAMAVVAIVCLGLTIANFKDGKYTTGIMLSLAIFMIIIIVTAEMVVANRNKNIIDKGLQEYTVTISNESKDFMLYKVNNSYYGANLMRKFYAASSKMDNMLHIYNEDGEEVGISNDYTIMLK